jgi:hypothetical protein
MLTVHPLFDLRNILIQFHFSHQPVRIEPPTVHRNFTIGRPGPKFFRAVPIEFNAIVIGITRVKSLADTMIAGPIPNEMSATMRRRKAMASAFRVGYRRGTGLKFF